MVVPYLGSIYIIFFNISVNIFLNNCYKKYILNIVYINLNLKELEKQVTHFSISKRF